VAQSGEGDVYAVLEFSDQTAMKTQLTGEASVALDAIENAIKPGDQPTRYAQVLRAAEKVALQARTGKRIIHLISDFQQAGWTAEERQFGLGAGIELRYVDLGSDEFSNLAIRNVHIIKAEQSSHSELLIKASVAEFGNRDRNSIPVRARVDERVIAERLVNVPKEDAEEIEFRIPDLSPGEHPIVLEIDDPHLERDNRYYMTVKVQGKTPVAVVEKPEARGRRSTSFFLAKALNVDRLSPYSLTAVSADNLAVSGKLLVWNDVAPGTAAVQNRLRDFVKEGGGLIIVLGGTIKPAEFNRTFGSWIPAKMETASTGQSPSRARPADSFVVMTDLRLDHPIFQPFGKPHSGTFSTARFYSYSPIVAESGSRILASFDNGYPALISAVIEKGRILIFASSADNSGNDLPLKAVYAPFWQQMLRHLESFEEPRYWLEVGDVLDPKAVLFDQDFRRGGNELEPGEAVAILDPEKQRLEISSDSGSIVTEKAGFYDVRTVGTNIAVAVNTVPEESDLTHYSAEEMTSSWMTSNPALFSQDEAPTAEERDRSQQIWFFLFLAALLFLISESLLSNTGLKASEEEK
jgi:hypothetical protein